MTDKWQVPISLHDNFCAGYGNPGGEGSTYLVGFVLATGKTKIIAGNTGSRLLEKIDAFDRAEVQDTMIGQINMITVSSFCGPMGRIWGYDLAKHENLRQKLAVGPLSVKDEHGEVFVYSLKPLLEATKSLYGTVDKRNFPLLPGEHVPCATKSLESQGPGYLYSCLSVAIPVDRDHNACLLMEDVGVIAKNTKEVRGSILTKMAEAALQVGRNQKVRYREIFTEVKFIKVETDEIGCALVAAPYFTLAKKAVLPHGQLFEKSLGEWEKLVGVS